MHINTVAALALFAFTAAFFAVWLTNQAAPAEQQFIFLPPYHYEADDYWSYLTAFFFATVFSLLFFGAGAPIAMAIEGAKYASLYSVGVMPAFDLAFAVPTLIAALAAATLGQGVIADYRNKGSLFDYWRTSVLYFNTALLLFFILLAIRATVTSVVLP